MSPFKFLPSFGILALARSLAVAVKISHLYPQASKLDIWLKKDYKYLSDFKSDLAEALHKTLNCDFRIPHSLRDFCVSIAAWGWGLRGAVKISSHCLQINKLDISSHQAVASGSKVCYSKLSPVLVILGSRQSSLYNQDLNFQFNFKSKFGKPIPEKR